MIGSQSFHIKQNRKTNLILSETSNKVFRYTYYLKANELPGKGI